MDSGLGLPGFSSDSWWSGQAAWQAGAGVPREAPSSEKLYSWLPLLHVVSSWHVGGADWVCLLHLDVFWFGLLGKIRDLTGEGREAYLCSEPFLVKA